MSISRRATLIAALGLAPIASAIGAESFISDEKIEGPIAGGSSTTNAAISAALRNLVDEIDADRILTTRLDLSAAIEADSIVLHRLTISFCYAPDIGQS